ncbi:MAG: phosphatidylinositol-specific phospholipase C/glycerophosphodiester phosphodiesterase family protein [Fimbriimonadaceae bacterium]|nr:phosphatidylinositol-specific phospholipase C/glycerophosphodiester phosphodiesterase family protein [Fimbriimonadaceae bacterium]
MIALTLALLVGATPLANAHAHNDYEHKRPLADALDQGFTSVEADIFLVDGELLVGHDKKDLKPERTLDRLYLEPLYEGYKARGGIYTTGLWVGEPPKPDEGREPSFDARFPFKPAYGQTFQLLIDIKTGGAEVYPVLAGKLKKVRDMLTQFGQEVKPGMVTVVISGDRPVDLIQKDKDRLCAIDGRPIDLDGDRPKDLVPLVSENWLTMFRWLGVKGMPSEQRQKLHDYISKAHRQGRRVRFWGAPDNPDIWRVLWNAGVDYIGSDNLPLLTEFILRQPIRR